MRSLSAKTLKELRLFIKDHPANPHGPALMEKLDFALKPKRSVQKARKRRATKRISKNEETARIREAVFSRAGNQCEIVNVGGLRCENVATDLAHLFGKGHRQQTERNCAAACWVCHRVMLTMNKPSARECWQRVALTFARLGFHHEEVDAWDYVAKAITREEQNRELKAMGP